MNETFPLKQTKFNGEIAPTLYGDTSNPKYMISLRTCKNWIPSPQGALVKRPGTRFIAQTRNGDGSGAFGPSKLVSFLFSDAQAFFIELSNAVARFYQNGAYVGTGGLGAGAYRELATPFVEAMFPYLKTVQVGDTITAAYGGQAGGAAATAPQDILHTPGAIWPWTIGATPLKIPIVDVPAPPVVNIGAWNAGTTYKVGDQAALAHVLWTSLQDSNLNNTPPVAPVNINAAGTGIAGNIYWTPSVDTAHPAVTASWVFTAVVQDPNGVTFETGPSTVVSGTGPRSTDRKIPLLATGLVSALPAGWSLLFFRLYAALGQSTLFGFLQDFSYVGGVGPVYDQGQAPDFTRQPPKGTDPFLVNGADIYPSVVGYLDQRRLFTVSNTAFLSRVGDFYNFDNLNIPGSDSDAFNITLASEVLEQIRSFRALRRGLLLTGQGEWAVAGLTGGPVSRASNDPKRQSKWGSSWIDPVVIGTGVLFNTAKSNQVRDLYPLYGLYADIWDGQDLTVTARHLFDYHTVKAWAFQSVPYPVLWIVRDDGVLVSLTYQHAPPSFGQQLTEGVVAWAQHSTGSGSDVVEDVIVVPEPPDDAVYLIVNRLVNGVQHRYIERMSSPIPNTSPYVSGVADPRYSRYLDCRVNYDGHNDMIGFAGVNATIDSVANPGSALLADYAIGKQIKINIAAGPFVAADAAAPYGSAFVFDPEGALGVGPLKAHIVGYVSGAQVVAELDSSLTQAQVTAWRAGRAAWAVAKGQLTAAHLSGYALDSDDVAGARGVHALVDGDAQLPAAWAAGVASFLTPGVVITLGLAYNADVLTLDAHHPNAELRNKFGDVLRVGVEVAGTRDMWMGKDFDNLAQMEQRSVSDEYNVMGLQTGYFETFVTGEYNKTKRAALRHFLPLPAILTSVLREIKLGDS